MLNKIYKNGRFYVFFILFSGFMACGQMPLYQDLSETDVNEILVALQDRGIEAEKVKEEKSQKVSWIVLVSKKDAAKARKILVESNLPYKKQPSLRDICKDSELIPTPQQEKCKKMLALKGEIINSLERIPGVVDADIVLNIPDISEFAVESQPGKRPTASAVLKVRKTPEGLEITESKIQRFISNTVENLDPRDVSVVITYIQPPEEVRKEAMIKNSVIVAGIKMDISSKKTFKTYALVTLVILIGISAALIFSLFQLIKLRQQVKFKFGENSSLKGQQDQNVKLVQSTGGEKGENPQIPAAGQTTPKS